MSLKLAARQSNFGVYCLAFDLYRNKPVMILARESEQSGSQGVQSTRQLPKSVFKDAFDVTVSRLHAAPPVWQEEPAGLAL